MYPEFYETVDGVHSCEVTTRAGSVVALTIVDTNGRFETFLGAEKVGFEMSDLASAKAQLFAILAEREELGGTNEGNAATVAGATWKTAAGPTGALRQIGAKQRPGKAAASTRGTSFMARAGALLAIVVLIGAALWMLVPWVAAPWGSEPDLPSVLAKERIELRVRDQSEGGGASIETTPDQSGPDRAPATVTPDKPKRSDAPAAKPVTVRELLSD